MQHTQNNFLNDSLISVAGKTNRNLSTAGAQPPSPGKLNNFNYKIDVSIPHVPDAMQRIKM